MPLQPIQYSPLPYVRDNSVGELLRLRGQHAAEAERQHGDLIGSMFARLGDQLSQSVLSYAKEKEQAPLRAAQLAETQAQAEERTRATTAAKQAATANSTIDTLMKSSLTTDATTGATTYDRNKLQAGFTQAGIGHIWPQYSELVDKSDSSLKTLKEAHKAAISDVARLVDASGNDATVFNNELMRGVKNGLFTKEEAAPYFEAAQRDPGHIAKLTAAILGKKPELMAVPAGESVIDKDNPQGGAVFTAPESEAQKAARVNLAADNTRADAAATETVRHNKAMEARPVAGAAAGQALTDDGVEYAATQYRVTGKMPALGNGAGDVKAKIISNAAAQAKALGQTPAASIQKQSAYAGDAKALAKMQAMSASAEAFETKAISQIDIVRDLSNKVGRTQFPLLNQAIVAGKADLLGDTNAQLLYNAISTFSTEYAKIMEGSTGSAAGSSDSARAAAKRLIDAKLNKGTLSDTLDLMQREMNLTLQGYDATIAHITDRMGGTAPPAAQTPPPTSGAPTYQDYLKSRGQK